ncbi:MULTISPECIES: Ycf66 family protein [unclassified Okeania]|uniref:Ycf66 family protein n=1 Tax=unclassified Okeania TaxID=2634635 RepID=UPI00257DAC6C|nr:MULTISPECIES: Ycf66 family protein [unclassified Okeania]
MVNLFLNYSSLLGLLDILLALLIFNESLKKLLSQEAFDIVQWIFVPIAILWCGGILIFQGWRLDPILFFVMFLLHIILVFLVIKTSLYNIVSHQKAFNIIQWIFVQIFLPIAILLCGGILLYQGWRLDSILSFAIFLLISVSIFLGIKDIFK